MTPLIAIILGLVQGLTEFIPVSSSGHLEIAQRLLGDRSADFHLFLEFINFGTLLALLWYFRRRLAAILRRVFIDHNFNLAINLIITTIPAGLLGLLLSHFIEESAFFSSLYTIAIAMSLIGLLMINIDRLPHLSKLKNENKLTRPRALLIGLAQVCALVPGTSRSGSTIVAGRLVGLSSGSAAEYSFLASIPIMCGVCLKSLLSSSSRDYLMANLAPLALSNLIALVAGLFALRFVMNYLKKPHALRSFGLYRLVLATLILIFALIT